MLLKSILKLIAVPFATRNCGEGVLVWKCENSAAWECGRRSSGWAAIILASIKTPSRRLQLCKGPRSAEGPPAHTPQAAGSAACLFGHLHDWRHVHGRSGADGRAADAGPQGALRPLLCPALGPGLHAEPDQFG